MGPTATLARRLWEAIEPVHAVVYFAPGPAEAARRAGLRGFWMGYFAEPDRRAAAMSASLRPGPGGARDRNPVPVPCPCSAAGSPCLGLHVRQAVPGDRQALAAMLARCTAATRYGRFHAPVRSFPEPYLSEALAGHAEHAALVAEQDGAAIALASCRTDPAGGAELGILVEDRWQRRGIGTRLLGGLIQHADQQGLRPLKASVLAEQRWILRVLRSYGTCQTAYTGNAFDVTLHRQPDAPRSAGR